MYDHMFTICSRNESVPQSLTPISVGSEEFALLSYKLKLASPGMSLVLQRAFALSWSNDKSFENRSDRAGVLVEGWVDCAGLDQINSVQSVSSKGFAIPSRSGLALNAGSISEVLQSHDVSSQNGSSKCIQLYLCTALLRRSYDLDKDGVRRPGTCSAEDLPSGGFDCFHTRVPYTGGAAEVAARASQKCKLMAERAQGTSCKCSTLFAGSAATSSGGDNGLSARVNEPDELKALLARLEGGAPSQKSPEVVPTGQLFGENTMRESPGTFAGHQYIVFDSKRVIPRYLVDVRLVDNEEDTSSVNGLGGAASLCDGCQSLSAVVWCEVDQVQLCDVCDREVHKHALMKRHVRVPLSMENSRVYLKAPCSSHTGRIAEFYCDACRKLLCVECKVSGSHSSGAMACHALQSLRDLYSDMHKRCTGAKLDADLETYTGQIDRQIRIVSEEISKVQQKASDVEAQIRAAAEKAIKQCQAMSDQKVRILKSDLSTLSRMAEEVYWSQIYMDIASHYVPPLEFIHMWKCYLGHSKRMSANAIPTDILVRPDLCLAGELRVISPSEEYTASVSQVGALASPSRLAVYGATRGQTGSASQISPTPALSQAAPSVIHSQAPSNMPQMQPGGGSIGTFGGMSRMNMASGPSNIAQGSVGNFGYAGVGQNAMPHNQSFIKSQTVEFSTKTTPITIPMTMTGLTPGGRPVVASANSNSAIPQQQNPAFGAAYSDIGGGMNEDNVSVVGALAHSVSGVPHIRRLPIQQQQQQGYQQQSYQFAGQSR